MHARGSVLGFRICHGQIEAASYWIGTCREQLRLGQGGARPIGLKATGKANALGVVAAKAERRSGGRRQGVDDLGGGEAAGREPAGGVAECRRDQDDHDRNQHQTPRRRSGGRRMSLNHRNSPPFSYGTGQGI